ncbi:MAG TPA: hypothetical protein V6C85_02450, partial [Allocoleopsis sp.]
ISLGLAVLLSAALAHPALGNPQEEQFNSQQRETELTSRSRLNQETPQTRVVRNTPTMRSQQPAQRSIGLGVNSENREQLRHAFPELSPKLSNSLESREGLGQGLDNSDIDRECYPPNSDTAVAGEAPIHNYQFCRLHVALNSSSHVDVQVQPDPFTPDTWAIELLPQGNF